MKTLGRYLAPFTWVLWITSVVYGMQEEKVKSQSRNGLYIFEER